MESIQVLICRLAQATVAINIRHVQEIQPMTPCTPLPFSAPYIKGVVPIRGRLIPVMDLHTRFGWPTATESEQRLVVLKDGEADFAIIVDETKDVTDVQWNPDGDIPEEMHVLQPYAVGTCLWEGRTVALLEPQKLNSSSSVGHRLTKEVRHL